MKQLLVWLMAVLLLVVAHGQASPEYGRYTDAFQTGNVVEECRLGGSHHRSHSKSTHDQRGLWDSLVYYATIGHRIDKVVRTAPVCYRLCCLCRSSGTHKLLTKLHGRRLEHNLSSELYVVGSGPWFTGRKI